ncbi:hypothetical protein A3762_14905 [Oleiphilus sp. HI0125]|uniref:MBL fold metallo-hydrolase n=1 Tax=Oleiphilus sp. HI0125 TaxID=1822266 RepID=UPI0007C20077|nr:MBL fold metallo-hydrolase [Oleiphilus sp. HI0125]KZZ60961.1 hypothetical protein A3762_14905 [Oleiphilus sp. HI0125]
MLAQFMMVLEERIVAVPYKQWSKVDDALSIKFKQAGHILGSAYVECRVWEVSDLSRKAMDYCLRGNDDKNTIQKVVFSGDLGAPYSPLLNNPKAPYSCDTLVIESTYGDKEHESSRNRKARLQKVIERAVQDSGVVLILAFSIGRTQELLYELEGIIHRNKILNQVEDDHSSSSFRATTRNLRNGRSDTGSESDMTTAIWNDIEVIIDSPLAAKFTKVYRKLEPYWDAEARKRVRAGRHPLSFE